jgi:DNA-binding HxlR family transcriptional regulator
MGRFDQATLELISVARVVEIFAVLEHRPATVGELARVCRCGRRTVRAGLRALAAAGAIERDGDAGTWDGGVDPATPVVLSRTGRALADRLMDLEAWTEAFRDHLHRR